MSVGSSRKSDYLAPDDLVKQILSDQAAVVTNRTAQFSPAIRTNAFVIVDLACGRLRRCARKCIAALLAADEALHDTWLDGATA